SYLVDKLCVGGSAADAEQIAGLFTEDCTLEFGKRLPRMEGRAGVKKLFAELMPGSRAWCWHSMMNPIIDIDGNRATAKWTLLAYSMAKGKDDLGMETVVGRYEDVYVRAGSGWQQKSLVFIDES